MQFLAKYLVIISLYRDTKLHKQNYNLKRIFYWYRYVASYRFVI